MRTIAIRDSAPAPVVALAAALLLFAVACGGDSSKVPSDAVAVVGGEQAVAKGDLDRLFDQARANSRASRHPFPKPGSPQYSQMRAQLVQFLVRRAQFAAEADARGIEISDEQVERRRGELVERYFGGSEKLYAKQLEKSGVTDEQTRADLKATLIEEALLGEVGKDVKVSEAELRRYYAKNKREYATPASREIRQILLKPEQGALARRLADELRSGASFVQLARRHSQDPRSKEGGGRLELPKGQSGALDKVVFSIPAHEISDPVRTPFGWHVIEALGPVQRAKARPYKQVRTAIREELLQAKRAEASAKYLERLARKHDIRYQVGFAPGA